MAALLAADLPMTCSLVISNNPDATGLAKAQAAGIATKAINHREFDCREEFDQCLIDTIKPLKPDWILLAGFMRRLSATFVQAFEGKVINIHPSLLPKYPGLNTYERALAAGDKKVGTSIHVVTEAVDCGPILAQASVDVSPNDTVDTLKAKVQALEHRLYPQVMADLLDGSLK